MSKYFIRGESIKAIADGFRASRGTEQEYSLDEMAVLAAEKVGGGGPLQAKTAYPSHSEQIIAPDEDYYGLVSVTVKPVPKLPACVVEIKTPSGVEYYYNHEQLPEIPADVVAKYPYLVIMRSPNRMRIIASTEKAYYHTMEDGSRRITVNSTGAVYRADVNTVAGGWVTVGFGNGTWFGVDGSGTYVVWWSNYDIPNGSVDAEEIYFPASQPQAEQPAEATHFYYNGVRLPKIPGNVLESYPYVYMTGTKAFGAFSVKPYFYSTTAYPSTLKADGSGVNYKYDEETDSWVFDKEYSSVYVIINGFHWTNYDMPNGSETATDIYFYGTPAVPDPME